MPLVKISTSTVIPDDKREALMAAVSKAVAEALAKPEQYMMVTMDAAPILLAGKKGPAAFVDLRAIGGLSSKVNARLAERLCGLLEESLAIPRGRVYLNFTDIQPANWGHGDHVFG
jgi:phenylpyruvate tautomerase PptA (4-oxalocrotonate tautomerase family)